MNSIFEVLKAENLTTLSIRYDFQTEKVNFMAAREWDKDTDFSRFNKDFYVGSIMADNAVYYGTDAVREIFERNDASEYLDEVLALIHDGKHFGIDCFFNEKWDIRYAACLHSPREGINNMRPNTYGGGFRRHDPSEPEIEVIADGLNLSRAQSYKNYAIQARLGGQKSVVIMEPVDLENKEEIGFIGYCMSRIRSATASDLGFPVEINDLEADYGYSVLFNGGPRSKMGLGGPPTAWGVYLSMKEAAKFVFDTDSLKGLTVAVQGLGNVGSCVAQHCLDEGAKLIVTDINEQRVKDFISKHPDDDITGVAPDEIMSVECDILSPSAAGGVLSDETIPKLNCKMVFGCANNQLKSTSKEDDFRLCRMLADRGILFQESWWHNGGGVWAGTYEKDKGDDANYEELCELIGDLIPEMTAKNIAKSIELGITPTECAYLTVEDAMYGYKE